jgi:hypothetical protein
MGCRFLGISEEIGAVYLFPLDCCLAIESSKTPGCGQVDTRKSEGIVLLVLMMIDVDIVDKFTYRTSWNVSVRCTEYWLRKGSGYHICLCI